jgi:hypothetical protein
MFLILISWIYIAFTSVNIGVGVNQFLGNTSTNIYTTSIKGLFGSTLLASIWAIFYRINIEFHAVLLVLNLIVFLKFKTIIIECYIFAKKEFTKLSKGLKLYLLLISVLIIAQCASIPYIIDNETYYIQTIKWLNEYGFVKGLANLHIFLGQTSGWHITQSVFNFSFIYHKFNDLSGFCLLLGNFFAIEKLHNYFINQNKNHFLIGLLPIANVLFFQFISAPSPDLPVYILSFIAFLLFVEHYHSINQNSLTDLVVITLFIFYIKPTTFLLLLLPLFIVIKDHKKVSKLLFQSFTLGLFTLALFITKNIILTGYPLFPLTSFSFHNYDCKVPSEMVDFYFNQQRLYRFFLTNEEFHSLSFWEKCSKWIFKGKISSFFNVLSLILVVIIPFFIRKYFHQKAYWILYGIMVVQLILLIITSPQFRFFIHFNLFFGFLLVASFHPNRKIIQLGLIVSIFLVSIMLFFPIKYSYLTQNQLIMDNSKFSKRNIVFPYQNSKLKTDFHTVKNGNLSYHSPESKTFFWANGNGKLPCVNANQIDYFGARFHYIPQWRTSDMKDGFYSKKWVSYD